MERSHEISSALQPNHSSWLRIRCREEIAGCFCSRERAGRQVGRFVRRGPQGKGYTFPALARIRQVSRRQPLDYQAVRLLTTLLLPEEYQAEENSKQASFFCFRLRFCQIGYS